MRSPVERGIITPTSHQSSDDQWDHGRDQARTLHGPCDGVRYCTVVRVTRVYVYCGVAYEHSTASLHAVVLLQLVRYSALLTPFSSPTSNACTLYNVLPNELRRHAEYRTVCCGAV
uniref:Uncharacterized protein n=1 Tax=Haptolina ericina TaxID=156174 RepID=A0A7S3AXM8_9EUKA